MARSGLKQCRRKCQRACIALLCAQAGQPRVRGDLLVEQLVQTRFRFGDIEQGKMLPGNHCLSFLHQDRAKDAAFQVLNRFALAVDDEHAGSERGAVEPREQQPAEAAAEQAHDADNGTDHDAPERGLV
ncbi:MAG: hypothetical protein ACXWVS_03640 [Hyphomicrobium sp.]